MRRAMLSLLVAMALVAATTATPSTLATTQDTSGLCEAWTGVWQRVEHSGTLTLTQSGSSVTGSYDWSGGGSFTGRLTGYSTLKGDYNDGGGSGEFVLYLSADGQRFSGTYEGTTPTGSPLSGSFGGIRQGENPCPDPGQVQDRELGEDLCARMHQDIVERAGAPPESFLGRGFIGEVVAHTGEAVHDYCTGGTGTTQRGSYIRIGDCIRTGPNGRMRIMLADRDESRNAGPSMINIAANTEMCFDRFSVNFGDPPEHQGLVELITGKIMVFLKGWGNSSNFSVRAGVAICGIRGTEALISHDPGSELAQAVVKEGLMEVTSEITGETRSLGDLESLVVTSGEIGFPEGIEADEWDMTLEDSQLRDEDIPISAGDSMFLVDPSKGRWHLLPDAVGSPTSFYYGAPGDYPIMGDWDCDGVDTPGMYRQSDGYVYLRNSNTTGVADIKFHFGIRGDIPIAGDWDGDGCDTLGVFRDGHVFLANTLGANDGWFVADDDYWFGVPGDSPFTGDFNGDGKDTVGLYRESAGFVYFTEDHGPGGGVATTDNEFYFGIPGDRVTAGDWTGDGIDTVAVFRPTDNPPRSYFSYENRLKNADEVVELSTTRLLTDWIPVGGRWTP